MPWREIKFFFKPEFRNRLDSIIAFNRLTKDVVYKIVNKFIFQLEHQLSEKNISINLSDQAREWLAVKGYNEEYGARPLARLMQVKIKEPIANYIISNNDIKLGGFIKVKLVENDLHFNFKKNKSKKKIKT